MGTLADKLNKVLDTKERIRQALISIGEDVPEDLPFSKYPDLINPSPIKGVKGIVGVYTAKGLTNDQMSANPVWEDQSKYKNHLQMKNFSWSEMSGVGGYKQDYTPWILNDGRAIGTKTDSKLNITSITSNVIQFYRYPTNNKYNIPSCTVKITGLEEPQSIRYRTQNNTILRITVDGVYTLPSYNMNDGIDDGGYYGFQFERNQSECNIVIEQIPDYPGAIVFDGVDDYGICDTFPILKKEDGYTVMALRRWLTPDAKTNNEVLVSNLTDSAIWGTYGAFNFEIKYNGGNPKSGGTVSFGKANNISVVNDIVSYQTSVNYNNTNISPGTNQGGDKLFVGSGTINNYYANVAIYSVVVIDHDATDEEIQKVIDYWKQEYTELFFDQAWTVVGKTNNDSDKAVIKNLTGNGNNLNLYNFSFSKSSGYGSYKWNFKDWSAGNVVDTERSSTKLEFKGSLSSGVWGYGLNKTVGEELPINVKVRVTGLNSNLPKLYFGKFDSLDENSNQEMVEGINVINRTVGADVNMIGFGFQEAVDSCDVVIEQIPDYEGYLVTDGIDDFVKSSDFNLYDDFTFVGEWILLSENSSKNAGIVKSSKLYVYNYTTGISLFINGVGAAANTGLQGVRSLKAICSDGRVYDENWNEIIVKFDVHGRENNSFIIGSNTNNNTFTTMAFRNAAFYSDRTLTKDQCINAYNYLQTFKN